MKTEDKYLVVIAALLALKYFVWFYIHRARARAAVVPARGADASADSSVLN